MLRAMMGVWVLGRASLIGRARCSRVGPEHSDPGSTYFLPDFCRLFLLCFSPKRELPCFLALSPEMLRGWGTYHRPGELQAVLGIDFLPILCT